MKYIILEDEKIAAERLNRLITHIRPNYKHVETLDSVETAVISLTTLNADLYFMDIQLADGLSFEIFDQISIDKPIIFTTAYDRYALQAFKQNSMDYLLKPIDEEELAAAIEKFEKLKRSLKNENSEDYGDLIKAIQPTGKKRFIVKVGDHLKSIRSSDIQAFYSHDKATYLLTTEGKKYLIDYSLEKVEQLLSKSDFYKISRKFIVNIHFIHDIVAYTNSRLEVKLNHFNEEQIIVARERVQEFKNWLDR
ncbi:MAG: LytR/AlgR family response regulator transcription factor [Cyclobacteriaceae bacterium]